jgi:hypothetical protein
MNLKFLYLFGIAITLTGCVIKTPDGEISIEPKKDLTVSIVPTVQESEPSDNPLESGSSGQSLGATPSCNNDLYSVWLAGQIAGKHQGSRVLVRPEPSMEANTRSYGLVGESIAVIGESFAGTDCRDHWYKVQFPDSGHQGWIFGDFVEINHQ